MTEQFLSSLGSWLLLMVLSAGAHANTKWRYTIELNECPNNNKISTKKTLLHQKTLIFR